MSNNETIDFAKYLTKNKGHGNGLIIKGGVRKGKTTLISVIKKILINETNFEIVSNVRLDNLVYLTEKRLHYVRYFSEYLNIYSNLENDVPILLVWDDSQSDSSFTSLGVMSKGGKDISSFLVFIGKLSTSFIYVAHKSYIPRSFIEGFEPVFIYKLDKKDFWISEYFYQYDSDVKNSNQNYRCFIPKLDEFNHFKILSMAFTKFEFDIDLQKLYDHLSENQIGENLKPAVKEFLNNVDNKMYDLDKYTISYQDLYIALCIKKGQIIGRGDKISTIFNDKFIYDGRKKIKEKLKLNLK